MNALMVSPRSLEHARDQLVQMRVEGNKETARLGALAECNFRIAVHPDTSPRRSIELLQEAVRIDGANPKYAYHLGRIHFLEGEFSASARWLRLACCLAPTSHRIWTHVAILLHELNEVYHGDENYEPNVLLQRAEKISAAIQAGEDHIDPDLLNFVPPKSRAAEEKEARQGQPGKRNTSTQTRHEQELRPSANVRRYLNARKCRWSGIDHLSIERLLQGRPTQANIRTMAPVLQKLATEASQRKGRPAALAILLVQWLIAGYPVETVRRLMKGLPDDQPSWQLLDTVCRLFEVPEEKLPREMAAVVDQGQLPPLVASLIHRQRLFWRPLEFRSLGAYRTARVFVAGAKAASGNRQPVAERDAEVARDLTRRLERAIANLDGKPPKPLKDEVPQEKKEDWRNPQAMLDRFTKYEAAAESLQELKEEAFRLLKEQLEPQSHNLETAGVFHQLAADREAAERFITVFAETIKTSFNQLQALVESMSVVDGIELPENFARRREACSARLQSNSSFGKFTKVLKRVDKRLRAVEEQFPEGSAEANPEWPALLNAVTALPSKEATSATASEFLLDRFAAVEIASTTVKEVRLETSDFLRDHLEPAAADPNNNAAILQAHADRKGVELLLEILPSAAEAGMQQLDWLAEELAAAPVEQLPENCDGRMEDARNRFRSAINLGSLHKRLKRIRKKLEAAHEARDAVGSPHETLQQLHARLEALTSPSRLDATREQNEDPPAAPSEEVAADDVPKTRASMKQPAPPHPSEEITPVEQLEYALLRVDWSVNQMFVRMIETFDEYPEWLKISPPFEALRRHILSRLAETIYRLGHRRRARRIWNSMLRVNRLDVHSLKNIAVCDVAERDVANSLISWREYAELLYLFDVLSRSPADHAAVRSEFHRAFGNAYAPPFLSAPFDHEWQDRVDTAALIAFLSSPGRFRSFIHHRLLEYLNTRFQFKSPSLVLGMKRVECEAHLEEAEKTMTEFARHVSSLIPGRAAERFGRLTEETIQKAAEQCRHFGRLTLQTNPQYDQEEKQQIELLARMFDLKLKLAMAFNANLNLVKNITSLEFLKDLNQLDAIPLKVSPGLFPIVANTMGLDPETLEDLTNTVRMNVIVPLLKYLLKDDDPAEKATRQRQYQLLTSNWLQDDEFRQFARWVDSPDPFMPEEVVEALQKGSMETALPYLRRWHDDYPAMAGLAVIIANHLFKHHGFEEAHERLERSRELVLYEPTRRYIHYLLVQILLREMDKHMDDEQYEDALRVTVQMVHLDDFHAALITQTLQLFTALSQQRGYRVLEHEVFGAIDGWLERAAALVAEGEAEDDPLPRPSEADIEQVRKSYQEARENS